MNCQIVQEEGFTRLFLGLCSSDCRAQNRRRLWKNLWIASGETGRNALEARLWLHGATIWESSNYMEMGELVS